MAAATHPARRNHCQRATLPEIIECLFQGDGALTIAMKILPCCKCYCNKRKVEVNSRSIRVVCSSYNLRIQVT